MASVQQRENYDVVIIGSGIGGMTSAALLTLAGFKTLVVEKLPLIGGRCSSVRYKDFELTTGVVMFPMRGGPLEPIFEQLGADFDVRLRPESYYRIRGKDYPPPEGKGRLRTLLSAASSESEAGKVMKALRRAVVWQEPSPTISFREWLLQYTQDEGIMGVFQTFITWMHGIKIEELAASEFIYSIKETTDLRSFGVGAKGSGALMRSLADAMKKRGSDVWTHCRAKQIIVADGTAKGVVVEKEGEKIEIEAKAVISNTGPKKTVELGGRDNFEKSYLKELGEKLRPIPYVWFAIAANEPLLGEKAGLMLTDSRVIISVSCPSLICPDLAPPGKYLIYAGGCPERVLPPFNMKKEIESGLQDLKDNLPQFESKAEILLTSCFYGDWPLYHTCYTLPQKTSIENLYNVGDGVKPPGWAGLPACVRSAQLVVEDLKERIKPGGES